MAKLAASILSADFYRLGVEIEEAISLGTDWIHVDVMDGHFVPPITFGSKIVKEIKTHNKNFFCDVHLMVTNPEDQIVQFAEAGSDLINFHCEVAYHGDRLVNIIKEKGKLVGVTLNPATPVTFLEHYLPIVDLILVMSVNPGYGGQKCIEYNFKKLEFLKEKKIKYGYKYLIEIDGGINLKNVKNVLEAGAEVIVAGSAFFNASKEEKIEFLNIVHNFKE